jgi:molybdopterin-guanine dinucleotide biosynthesis protein A
VPAQRFHGGVQTSMTSRAAGIILAGGSSRRMGEDKSRLVLGDRTLLAHVIGRVASACRPVVVVARTTEEYRDCGAEVIADRWPGSGPLGGLITGLGAVAAPCAVVVAADLPFVEPALLSGLLTLRAGWDAVIPEISGLPQPHCAIYARAAIEVAEAVFDAGGRSLRELIDAPGVRVLYVKDERLRAWDPDLRSFLNVNTPEDLELAREMLDKV